MAHSSVRTRAADKDTGPSWRRTMEVLKRLEWWSLIGTRPAPQSADGLEESGATSQPPFDALDVRLGRSIRELLDLGVAIDDLEVYARHLALAKEEAALIHDKVLHDRAQGVPRVPNSHLKQISWRSALGAGAASFPDGRRRGA